MERPIVVIEANQGASAYWTSLWRFRDLLFQLTWKELLVRYRQAVGGVFWAFVRPILPMVILVLVFDRLAGFSSEGVPYPVFVFAGLLPWLFITSSLSAMASSLVGNAHLISKVYFPRLLIPLSTLGANLFDLLISMGLLLILMVWYDCRIGSEFVFFPAFVLLAVGTALGLGLWFGSLSVRHRDFIHVLPFLTQFGLYISPVGFGTHLVPEKYRPLFALNPMTGIIDGFRWSLLGVAPDWPAVCFAWGLMLVTLTSGIWYFRKQEQTFADVI